MNRAGTTIAWWTWNGLMLFHNRKIKEFRMALMGLGKPGSLTLLKRHEKGGDTDGK